MERLKSVDAQAALKLASYIGSLVECGLVAEEDEGVNTWEELAGLVPRQCLSQVLGRLLVSGLVVRVDPSAMVLHFAAKRWLTRKLSPTEMRVFKAFKVKVQGSAVFVEL